VLEDDRPRVGYAQHMRPRLLVLDNSGYPLLFREDRAWFRHFRAADITVVNMPHSKRKPSLDGFTHVLAGGSESSILQPKPWFDREAEILREAVDRGLPVLGSCFGHQMLVHALSGAKYIKRSDLPEIGWITVHKTVDDRLLVDVPSPWRTMAYHFDEATDLPAPWKVLAHSEACPVQITRYGSKPVWGIQPHPEISRAKARVFLPVYRVFVGKETKRAICTEAPPTQRDDVASAMAKRFLEHPPAG